jgi:hypothetical protein
MKILVSLSSYGDKNLHLLNSVIDEYKSYKKYDVAIEVHCTVPLPRTDINQIIHDNPPTTSLFHRKDFIRDRYDYDLFLFGEYDMLIRESAIDTYLEHDKTLPTDTCIGFIRYENTPENLKYLIDLWSIPGYNYIRNNNILIQDRKYFSVTNVHQACYLLTKEKLQYVIDNTDYDYRNLNGLGVETSSSGIFADWEYGPRGVMQKVMPIDIEDLANCLIHHMPDCHCNAPGVNADPITFRSTTITEEQLFLDLNLR